MKKLVVFAAIVALSLTFTSCTSVAAPQDSQSAPIQEAPVLSSVTQAEVDTSAKSLDYSVDEFSGDESFGYQIPMSVYSNDASGNRATLAGQFQRKKGSEWTFQLAASYVGEEWLFFDSVNLLANSKTFEVTVGRDGKFEKVQGGGLVSEIGAVFLTQDEANEVLSLVKEGEVRFRLKDSRTGADFTGTLGKKMRQQLIHALTVYLGIQQGLYRF
jgi:hypothetical protein